MNSALNIVLVSYMDFTGPGVIHMFHFANGLVRQGHKVLFLVNGAEASVRAMSDKALFSIEELAFKGIELQKGLVRKIERFKPQLVHIWTPRNVPARIGLALKERFDIPLIIHYEDDEDILFEQADHAYFRHLSFAVDTFRHPEKWVWVHPFTYQLVNLFADRLTVISAAYGRALHERWGLPVSLLIPGVDLDRFSPHLDNTSLKKKLGLESKTVLIYGGSIAKFYEFEILLEAFRRIAERFPELVIVQYGRNFMAREINDFLSRHSLSARVHLLGQVPHHQVEKYLSLGDILVQPGQNNQFNLHRLPSKVPEYMAMGRPVVMFGCGIGDMFEHKLHAYKLAQGTADELAEAISVILTDEKLRKTLSTHSRLKAEELFSWSRSVTGLISTYQSTLLEQVKPTHFQTADLEGRLGKVLSEIKKQGPGKDTGELWQELAGLREFHRKVTATPFYKVYFYTKLYLNRFLGREKTP